MKKSILLLFTLGALAAAAQAGVVPSYYLASHGTNIWPPLPFNPRPGYPVITNGNDRIVQDTLSDQQVLSRGLWLMDSDEESGPPEPPGGYTDDPPPEADTNAFLGMYILGMFCPDSAVHSINHYPDYWEIDCINADWQPYPHNQLWGTLTRVCPGDVVKVHWHDECQYHTPDWPAFFLVEMTTNDNGSYRTNIGVGFQPSGTCYGIYAIPETLAIAQPMLLTNECWHPWSPSTNDCVFFTGPTWPAPLTGFTNICLDNYWSCGPTNLEGTATQYPTDLYFWDLDHPMNDPGKCRAQRSDRFGATRSGGGTRAVQQTPLGFSVSAVHGRPGIYVVETATALDGPWTTNADTFTGWQEDVVWTNGVCVWTNTIPLTNLVIDTNGLAFFYTARSGTNDSRFYRVRTAD